MIVVMKPGAGPEHIQHVVDLVHEFGLEDHVIYGTDRTVIASGRRECLKRTRSKTAAVEKVAYFAAVCARWRSA